MQRKKRNINKWKISKIWAKGSSWAGRREQRNLGGLCKGDLTMLAVSFFFKLDYELLFLMLFFLRVCQALRQWQSTPVLMSGKSHGWRSLVGCSPWGCEELDTTELLHFHFSLSCIGGGNGNPLQCSCLENPRDGGAWWAAVYGVAQSRTRLKRLSSSSSRSSKH